MAAIPFDQREGWIWFDGELVPWADAKIHVLTHGLHYGSCVFEGERAYGGEIFKSTEHSERLKHSAEMLDFAIPYSVAEIDAAKRLVLEKNGQTDAYVRPLAWRGSEMMGVSAQDNAIHLAIATWEWPSYFDPAQKMKGIRLDHRRLPPPRPGDRALRLEGGGPLHDLHDLQAQGGAERLRRRPDARLAGPRRRMHRRQCVLHPGRRDPHADRRLLPRRHHAAHRDRPRRAAAASRSMERRIMPNELETFNECFITGTAAEVTPVSEIGPYRFQPGNMTKVLMEDYTAEVQPKAKAA